MLYLHLLNGEKQHPKVQKDGQCAGPDVAVPAMVGSRTVQRRNCLPEGSTTPFSLADGKPAPVNIP
jgi:hypothetical protein